jgi:hypothetical protein
MILGMLKLIIGLDLSLVPGHWLLILEQNFITLSLCIFDTVFVCRDLASWDSLFLFFFDFLLQVN